jgi:hypothetical protein
MFASSSPFMITAVPTNTMMQGTNLVQQQGQLTTNIDFYIIPAAETYGVEISFNNSDS